ncbi:hypothetical protein CMI48_00150 [Candidatus Pacearchaeota archaeon]|nr:hypothetical protein [Candidatus Pacearchaeota archaeon]
MIVINFKNWKTGKEVLRLAKDVQHYFGKTDDVVLCVPATEIGRVGDAVELDVFAQHVDLVKKPESTGSVGVKAVKAVGGLGTLINHSEKRLGWKEVTALMQECADLGVRALVCVKTYREAKWVSKQTVRPWGVVYEGGSLFFAEKALTGSREKEIKAFADLFKESEVKALCGGGLFTLKDIKTALDVGCDGVVLDSAIAKVKKPERFLKGLALLG